MIRAGSIAPPHRAFSLIEVLAALSLTLVLVGSMFAFLSDLLNTRSAVLESAARDRAAITLIERLEVDLACAIVAHAAHGPGIRGDGSSLRVLSRSVNASLAERGSEDSTVFADLQATSIRFDSSQRALSISRGPADSPAPFEPLGGRIGRVRFRYHDGSEWLASFDSIAQARLPRAVEIAIWFIHPDDSDDAEAVVSSTKDAETPTRRDRSTSEEDQAIEDALAELKAASSEPTLSDDAADAAPPDRRRIILIPDAHSDADGAPPDA